ncbi:vWA domain-containing protein [Cytobacillus gottheilii]|uniref:vWA domain-containing protein n=1 Tax=Cytobacillus gottheilii TaxID=859144 RepID=UPI003CF6ABA5
MKNKVTEVVFILDKSGSMAGLEADTIGGYNSMLKKQKEAEGEAFVTTVLFNHGYELLHDRVSVKDIKKLTERDYEVSGTTALIDAIGFSIQKTVQEQKKKERADHVLFVITTDGMENASREFTSEKVKKMIQHQKEKYDWTFMFLGANIDAVETAGYFGIDKDFAVDYHADGEGTKLNYEILSEAVLSVRYGKGIDPGWKEGIERDFTERRKR